MQKLYVMRSHTINEAFSYLYAKMAPVYGPVVELGQRFQDGSSALTLDL